MYSGQPYSAGGYGLGSEAFPGSGETPPDDGGSGALSENGVLNLDYSQGRLGCGEAQFFITGRCTSTGVLCVLDDSVVTAQWDRRLDEVSQATVELEFGGTTEFTCCECLAEIEPWCHELHIWRDGEEVWVGPITKIEYTYDGAVITAEDALTWLNVRIPIVDFNFTEPNPDNPGGMGAKDLTEMAEYLLSISFAYDSPDFTCEMDNLYVVMTTSPPTKRFYERASQTALDILAQLAESELDFTVIGRTIVLFGDPSPLTPLIVLNDDHIIGEISVVKDGTLQGNRFYVHFDEDGGDPHQRESEEKYCYGEIQRLRDGEGLFDQDDADVIAEQSVAALTVTPRIINLPQGSTLSPDTPWKINQMIPGARVDVTLTKLCLNLTQSFRLTNVEVEYTEEGEQVRISLIPMNLSAVLDL